jgi:hypothetical protein
MSILVAIKREEKKLKRQLHKLQHQLEWNPSGREGSGRVHQRRSGHREEARHLRRWESEHQQGH